MKEPCFATYRCVFGIDDMSQVKHKARYLRNRAVRPVFRRRSRLETGRTARFLMTDSGILFNYYGGILSVIINTISSQTIFSPLRIKAQQGQSYAPT